MNDKLIAEYVGLKLDEAEVLARRRGMRTRIVSRDGRSVGGTGDYRLDRVNFSVKDDVVVDADIG